MSNIKNFNFFDDIQAYRNRLHINSILTMTINVFAAFLVLNYSTKLMGYYKYYILLTIFTSFLMDFHITAIYTPYPLIPIPAFCGAGPFKEFGFFWGECFHFYIMHFTLSFSGLSILCGFAYQYFSVKKNCEFFHTKKGVIIIFLVMAIYPIPTITLLSNVMNRKNVLIYVKNEFPDVYDFFVKAPCNGAEFNEFTAIYLGLVMFQIILIYGGCLYLGFKVYNNLAKLRTTMSMKTLKARKQYLYALFLQLTIPLVFIVVPIGALLLAVIIKLNNIKEFSQIALQILSFHSCVNAISIIFVIKPYREQIKQYFENNLLWAIRKMSSKSRRIDTPQAIFAIPANVAA